MADAADMAAGFDMAPPQGARCDNRASRIAPPDGGGPGARAPKRRYVLRKGEIEAILIAASEDERDHAAMSLLAFSPLRLSEICGLRVGDVVVSDDGWRMSVRVAARKGAGARSREVPLSDPAAIAVVRYLTSRDGADAGDPLFVGRDGRAMSPAALGGALSKYEEVAARRSPELFDGARVTPMALRRSAIMRMRAQGVDSMMIARYVGRRSL